MKTIAGTLSLLMAAKLSCFGEIISHGNQSATFTTPPKTNHLYHRLEADSSVFSQIAKESVGSINRRTEPFLTNASSLQNRFTVEFALHTRNIVPTPAHSPTIDYLPTLIQPAVRANQNSSKSSDANKSGQSMLGEVAMIRQPSTLMFFTTLLLLMPLLWFHAKSIRAKR